VNSTESKQALNKLQEEVLVAIKNIVAGRKLNLQRPIIFAEHEDDWSLNEVINSINSDMTVDTEFNYDVAEKSHDVKDFAIHIQIAVLEALEEEAFEIDEEE